MVHIRPHASHRPQEAPKPYTRNKIRINRKMFHCLKYKNIWTTLSLNPVFKRWFHARAKPMTKKEKEERQGNSGSWSGGTLPAACLFPAVEECSRQLCRSQHGQPCQSSVYTDSSLRILLPRRGLLRWLYGWHKIKGILYANHTAF